MSGARRHPPDARGLGAVRPPSTRQSGTWERWRAALGRSGASLVHDPHQHRPRPRLCQRHASVRPGHREAGGQLRAAHGGDRGPGPRRRSPAARLRLGGRPRGTAPGTGRRILVDRSAGVELLRDSGTSVRVRVDRLLGGDIATCHPVRMEGLAGARDERHRQDLRGLLARAAALPTLPADFEGGRGPLPDLPAAGEPVRRVIACLITAHAIRPGTPLRHADADLAVLARHSPLPWPRPDPRLAGQGRPAAPRAAR